MVVMPVALSRPLSPVQMRIIGCLLEKERTTPDAYPLTMNGLLAACNQISNRHPVVHLEEHTVANALENLRADKLVRVVYSRSNRAERFRQVLDETLELCAADSAILCVLMLRGPQTTNELRTRTERLHDFVSLEAIETTLGALAGRPEPFVEHLQAGYGRKERRWIQLLGGALPTTSDPVGVGTTGFDGKESNETAYRTGALDRPAPGPGSLADRVAALEAHIEALADELRQLQADLGAPPSR